MNGIPRGAYIPTRFIHPLSPDPDPHMAKATRAGKDAQTTPLMEQYLAIKAKHPDKVLLYRMGDFYETFYDDAKIISRVLGIALTKRAHGKSADVPLAGFPYHALDNHLPKLVQAGHRVAVCEQVEDPKQAKTVVKREVVEIVTPGTALSEKLLDHKASNFLAAVFLEGDRAGVGYGDFSTGEFYLAEMGLDRLMPFLEEVGPREVLLPQRLVEPLRPSIDKHLGVVITAMEDWLFHPDFATETLQQHFRQFGQVSLKGFDPDGHTLGRVAAGAVLYYTKENFQDDLRHVTSLSVVAAGDYMVLDSATRRNLEITHPILGQSKEGTLLSVLDHTVTPMGGRYLRQVVVHPLVSLKPINERLERVDALAGDEGLREDLRESMSRIADLERLLGRISTGRASPRDLVTLRNALGHIAPISERLSGNDAPALERYRSELGGVGEVVTLIDTAISETPPVTMGEGGIIRDGFNADLDELRAISREGKDWIVNLQAEEREKTGISSLKVGFNKVFGYYFEVTRAHQSKVPDYFIRKQTLVNAERYITPELKEFEEKVLGAEDRMAELEYRLFQEVREGVAAHGAVIRHNARLIAELDCFAGLADVAVRNRFVKPVVDDGAEIRIEGGRHPVVEQLLPPDEPFIDNDTHLDNGDTQIMLITGPNMSGKSTYLRQVGLIVLMAQIGSFVPAEAARVGLVDRIFTRVGASDNLAFGESTFMVEMLEAANILNNATARSLILLDEVGRGTSTYDGLSIAWAITEYLHIQKRVAAKTLFATHYHELTELADQFPRIRNFRVGVREYDDHVVFLHKIEAGAMSNSYGIYVAQMAGLPGEVIERAREVLRNLEASEVTPERTSRLGQRGGGGVNQLTLFEPPKPSRVEAEVRTLDLNRLTPIDALLKLRELKDLLDGDDDR